MSSPVRSQTPPPRHLLGSPPRHPIISPTRTATAAQRESPPAHSATATGSPARVRSVTPSGGPSPSRSRGSPPAAAAAAPPGEGSESDLSQFAAVVADVRRRSGSGAERPETVDDHGPASLQLKRAGSMTRQPSAPNLAPSVLYHYEQQHADFMASAAQPSNASEDRPRKLSFSGLLGARVQSAPTFPVLSSSLDTGLEHESNMPPANSNPTWSTLGPSHRHSELFAPADSAFPTIPVATVISPPHPRPLFERDPLNRPLLNGSPAASTDPSDLERDMVARRSVELKEHSRGLGRRQLAAVLKKNWLLKIRNPSQFICEMLSPLLMILVLVIGWVLSLKHAESYPDQRFANDTAIVQDVFVWVLNHIVPEHIIPTDLDFESIATQSPTTRFAHRREEQPGFVYGRSREEALAADQPPSHFMEGSMSSFSSLAPRDTRSNASTAGAPLWGGPVDSHPPSGPANSCFPLDLLPGQQFCYDSTDRSILLEMFSYNGPSHIPRFDEYVMVHQVLQYLLNNTASTFAELDTNLDRLDQFTNGRLANLIYLGKLIFAPDVPEVRAIVARLNQTYNLFDKVFTGVAATEDDAIALSAKRVLDDHDRTWAVLVFNELDLENGRLDFTVRMNSSVLPNTQHTKERFANGVHSNYQRYMYAGFLTLQLMIEEVALDISSGSVNSTAHLRPREDLYVPGEQPLDEDRIPTNPSVSRFQTITEIPFPVLHYDGNAFYQTIGPLIGLVFCMSMLYPTSRLIKGIVEEKETKTKETMKMMGLKDWVFHLSWFLTFFLQFLVTAGALVLLLHFTMMPHTSVSLLFAFFVCFFLSQIALGFLITVFFSRAKLAGVLGPIILFAATMPRYAFFSRDAASQNSPESVLAKTICSLFSPTAFTFGADLIMQYEGANLPLGWDNLQDDPFSMGRVLSFLVLDVVLYCLMAWYLDHVVPNEYGQRLHPLFFCRRAYWKDHVQADFNDEQDDLQRRSDDDGAVVEPMPASMHSSARVHIKKLRKQFTEGRGKSKRTTTAVHGLDLTLYEGQITALLGHNGAGKSTSISMLTGLIAPTGGDCSIHGYSVLKNMKEIRKSLGICPQINVLFGRLTVSEHLELYATLKGVKTKDRAAEVRNKIEEVGLTEKADIFSSALSGGMQRKLQVAMAFIGDSRVVFLDEPTSGMDPYSRRSTWELLRKSKIGRTIVLTTHFMDEADLLGDRIAIMSEGKLRCCGSSLFLKGKYGIGYNLTLVKASKKCRTDQVSKMVTFFAPEAKVLSTAGGEMSYRLPWSAVSQFPGLFAQLEERRHTMGIGGYGISQTTLEEVFMRCAQIGDTSGSHDIEDADGHHPFAALEEERKKRLSRPGSKQNSRPASRKSSAAAPPTPPHSSKRQSPPADSLHRASPSLDSLLSSSSMSIDEEEAPPAPRLHATMSGQFAVSFRKRYICATRDLMGRIFEIVLPILVVALVLLILKLNGAEPDADLLMKAEMYSSPLYVTPLWYAREATDRLEPATLYSLQHTRGIEPSLYSPVPRDWNDSTQMQDELLATVHSNNNHRYGALIFNDSIYTHFNYSTFVPDTIFTEHPPLSIMHNTTFVHGLPVLVAEIAQARWNTNRWRQALAVGTDPRNLSQVSYQLRNHPLPLTSTQSLRTKTYLSLFAALFILIPFCLIPASFVLFVVKERSMKSKHQQFVSGLHPMVYWAATYAWDMANYFVVAFAVTMVMLAYGSSQFAANFESWMATFLLFLLYGSAAIPLSYCYSFAFGNYTSAQVGIAGLNFLTGFVLVIGSFMLDNISSAVEINRQLKGVYRIFPSFALGEGLINLSTRDFTALLHAQPLPSPFEWAVVGRTLFYLAVESVVYVTITLLLESNFLARVVRNLFNLSGELADPGPDCVEAEDEDVAAERARVQKLHVTHQAAPALAPISLDANAWGASPTAQGPVVNSGGSLNAAGPAAKTSFIASWWNRNRSPGVQLQESLLDDADRLWAGQEEQRVEAHSQVISSQQNQLGSMAMPVMERGESSETVGDLPADHHAHVDAHTHAEAQSHGQEDVLVMQHLRKVYPARGGGRVTVAVDNLSLGIPRGQVFGFLGINGAGKTTSMKMLTGDIPISKGRAFINGFNVATQLSDVRKEIGYCPQFDPLLPDLTSRETLTLYAGIHGLPSEIIPETVQNLLNTLGLAKFADKVCGPYSGGNKRKLSLAIALIGNPSVVFLDEPSTGMDPVSRRFMWSVIESISDGRSIILTTHSMEECEALCSRVGIMVAGALQCLGSSQHLKSRFGMGYIMDVNCQESSLPRVQAFVTRAYPGATLDEMHAGRLKYRLPQQGTTLSSVFSSMEARKHQLGIIDYSISQCSLESIFIHRVQDQKDAELAQSP